MEQNFTYLLGSGGSEDILVSYTSPTPNSSAANEYAFSYSELHIICHPESIPAVASALFPVLYSLMFVTGLMGNALVLWILTVFMKIKTMTGVYLLNLTVSNLLLVFSLPFLVQYSFVNQWTFGNALCEIIGSLYFIGFHSNVFFITIMSIDRYLVIVHSLHVQGIQAAAICFITSLVIWAVSILASMPDLLFFQEVNDNNQIKCLPHYPGGKNGWRTFSNFEVNILGQPIPVVLIFCYHGILKNLQKCHTKNKYKAIKLFLIVVIVLFLSWTPVNIVLFLDSLRNMSIINDCLISQRLDLAVELTEALSFVHCCLNPVIYTFVGEKFKKHILDTFKKSVFSVKNCLSNFLGHENWKQLLDFAFITVYTIDNASNCLFSASNSAAA
ncbi:LOW QUALITY PROTEIN: C-C chemokine receptor type 8-like [Hirundo rustica]|uniref:LOW QUALITY PROTEIN: C-C chemokine receptor type 8-like n=1 Tax=Hirundo rustica TaxID=43150 RepID=UPI001A94A863|nr:LOW QUALITY PROTEIN: C-C chemokine receptor type 8-like [Hirundo rustica]